jgi:hypothetical protein
VIKRPVRRLSREPMSSTERARTQQPRGPRRPFGSSVKRRCSIEAAPDRGLCLFGLLQGRATADDPDTAVSRGPDDQLPCRAVLINERVHRNSAELRPASCGLMAATLRRWQSVWFIARTFRVTIGPTSDATRRDAEHVSCLLGARSAPEHRNRRLSQRTERASSGLPAWRRPA